MTLLLSCIASLVFCCQLWILFCTVRFYVKRMMFSWYTKSRASAKYCMCGDLVESHNFGSGHSPVSEFDYGMALVEKMGIES